MERCQASHHTDISLLSAQVGVTIESGSYRTRIAHVVANRFPMCSLCCGVPNRESERSLNGVTSGDSEAKHHHSESIAFTQRLAEIPGVRLSGTGVQIR